MKKRELLALLLLHSAYLAHAQVDFVFGQQFGTTTEEFAGNPVCDHEGNVYLAGSTGGVLGDRNLGNNDGFLRKTDGFGNVLWIRQFGTPEEEKIRWLTIDASGNLLIAGATQGAIAGTHFGDDDILIVKYDPNGNLIWQKQFGTSGTDIGQQICTDDDENIYVVGETNQKLGDNTFGKKDAFLMKLDPDGNVQFTTQFGTKGKDVCEAVAVAADASIYTCGTARGKLGEKTFGKLDAFVAQFSASGEHLKTVQFGTDQPDTSSIIAIAPDGSIYHNSSTGGDLAGPQRGKGDAVLMKRDKDLNLIWARQFGTAQWDGINGIDIEKSTGRIVAGGCQNWPDCQGFCRVYEADGTLVWTGNYTGTGPYGGSCGKAACWDNHGHIYHVGITGGSMFGPIQGKHDVYLLKLDMNSKLVGE